MKQVFQFSRNVKIVTRNKESYCIPFSKICFYFANTSFFVKNFPSFLIFILCNFACVFSVSWSFLSSTAISHHPLTPTETLLLHVSTLKHSFSMFPCWFFSDLLNLIRVASRNMGWKLLDHGQPNSTEENCSLSLVSRQLSVCQQPLKQEWGPRVSSLLHDGMVVVPMLCRSCVGNQSINLSVTAVFPLLWYKLYGFIHRYYACNIYYLSVIGILEMFYDTYLLFFQFLRMTRYWIFEQSASVIN